MAMTPAGACCAPQANKRKGNAEFSRPISAMRGNKAQRRECRTGHTAGSNTSVPSPTRTAASGKAPISGAATR